MALASFFDRIVASAGGHLAMSRRDLEERLGGVVIGVRTGDALSANQHTIAEFAVNLLARLYPRIALRDDAFGSQLRSIANSINPKIDFVDPDGATEEIAIGIAQASGSPIYLDAHGWVACATQQPDTSDAGPDNPFASAAAATFGVAEVFRRVFVQRRMTRDVRVSLVDYGSSAGGNEPLASLEIPDAALFGIGAVGNSAVWTLARHPSLRGMITLVDHETLDLSNLQRYVLGRGSDVRTPKVELAAREFERSALKIRAVQKRLELFADSYGNSFRCPVVGVSVDSIDARRMTQALLPRLVVNGWTGEASLGASWHVFDREAACLSCLYQPRKAGKSQVERAAEVFGLATERAVTLWLNRQPLTQNELQVAAKRLGVDGNALDGWKKKPFGDLYTHVVCGAAAIPVPAAERDQLVPLAHQSALAGVLMAAELIKRCDPALAARSESESLVAWDDVLTEPPPSWTRPRAREPGCICGDAVYQAVYREKWNGTSA